MENKEIWPCMFAGDCAHACQPGIVISASPECYITTDLGLRVRGDCNCKVLDDGTIAISYPTYGDEKNMLYEIVALLGQEKMVTFYYVLTRFLHKNITGIPICTKRTKKLPTNTATYC